VIVKNMYANKGCNCRRQECAQEKAENILKYKDLRTETQRMWNGENESYASNNRSNWNDLKVFQKIPGKHTGKHEIKELQKTAILGAARTYFGRY
jgi:hypothetical protein